MSLPPKFFCTPAHQPFKLGTGEVGALLIHGFPGTPAEMRPLGERLAAAGLTAYGFQLPGLGEEIMGLSEMTRDKWVSAMREHWRAVRQAHGQAVLVGYSMGGAIACHLAAALPPDGLVLLAPFWKHRHWLLRGVPLAKYVFRTVAPFRFVSFDEPEMRQRLQEMMPEADLDDPAVRAFLRDEVRLKSRVIDEVLKLGGNVRRVAPRVVSPTLVVQGLADEVVETAVTRRLLAYFAGVVSYHEIDRPHTFTQLTQPEDEQFVPLVLSFLGRLRLVGEGVVR